MNVNGLYAQRTFWGKVTIFDSTGTRLFITSRTSYLYNRFTKIYKLPQATNAWASIFNTAGKGHFLRTYIYEVHYAQRILAKIEVVEPGSTLGKQTVSLQDAQGQPFGSIKRNDEVFGGRELVFGSFTIFDEKNLPLATIDNKDRKAKIKLVIKETFKIVDVQNPNEDWQVIIIAILILTTRGAISS